MTEFWFVPGTAPGGMLGHYKFGFYYDSSTATDFYRNNAGGSAFATGTPFKTYPGKTGAYFLADQVVYRVRDDLPEDLPGVLVTEVKDGSWAAVGQLQSNDIVQTVNSQPVAEIAVKPDRDTSKPGRKRSAGKKTDPAPLQPSANP
jgi:carbohydrate-selective porin OprB